MPVITLTGPTCSGKTTIERELQRFGCGRAISHTTRLPRAGEANGVDYHYVTDAEYDRLKSVGEFIETVELGTRRYAMSKGALRAALDVSQNVAIVVDPHGAAQIRVFCQQNRIPVFSVWVDCDPKEQAQRWVSRFASDLVMGKEAVGAYAERMALMMTEEVRWRNNARAWMIDYERTYDKKVWSSDKVTPKELAGQILHSLPVTQ
jgi:guanylate kinase